MTGRSIAVGARSIGIFALRLATIAGSIGAIAVLSRRTTSEDLALIFVALRLIELGLPAIQGGRAEMILRLGSTANASTRIRLLRTALVGTIVRASLLLPVGLAVLLAIPQLGMAARPWLAVTVCGLTLLRALWLMAASTWRANDRIAGALIATSPQVLTMAAAATALVVRAPATADTVLLGTVVLVAFPLPLVVSRRPSASVQHGTVPASRSIWTVGLLTLLFNRADVVLLAILGGSAEEVAAYGVASRVAAGIAMPLSVVNQFVPPLIVRGAREEHPSVAIKDALRPYVWMSASATVAGMIVLAFAAEWAGPLLAPGLDEFVVARLTLVLSSGVAAGALAGPVGLVLLHIGREVVFRNASAVVLVISIIVQVAAYQAFSVMGFAIAVAASVTGLNLVGLILAHRYLGAHITLPSARRGLEM